MPTRQELTVSGHFPLIEVLGGGDVRLVSDPQDHQAENGQGEQHQLGPISHIQLFYRGDSESVTNHRTVPFG